MSLDQTKLREALDYDSATGIFSWKRARGSVTVGTSCTAQDVRGYVQIQLFGRNYKAHRLAWLHVHGEWPPHDVDHINGNPTDNRLCNLRLATRSENNANSGPASNNTSGVKGVSFAKRERLWHAYIKKDGRRLTLGYFKTLEEAAAARRTAEVDAFGEFARQSI